MGNIVQLVDHFVKLYAISRVPTGQGKLEKFREFEWSGKSGKGQGK